MKYTQELRDRAARLKAETRTKDPKLLLNAATKRIGPKLGVVPDKLRICITQVQVDADGRPGTTTEDGRKIKQLESEVRELKLAKDTLWWHRGSSRGSSTRNCRGTGVHQRKQGPFRQSCRSAGC